MLSAGGGTFRGDVTKPVGARTKLAIMKLFLAISAALAVLSTGVKCFVPSGGYALAHGARSNAIAVNAAFVQPVR